MYNNNLRRHQYSSSQYKHNSPALPLSSSNTKKPFSPQDENFQKPRNETPSSRGLHDMENNLKRPYSTISYFKSPFDDIKQKKVKEVSFGDRILIYTLFLKFCVSISLILFYQQNLLKQTMVLKAHHSGFLMLLVSIFPNAYCASK
jgi:hypothetical protein